jgi:hypothetical protein
VEHNAPQGRIDGLRHPAAGRDDLLLVHVTHFNELFWDAGGTPTRVIEHGIVDPARGTRASCRAPSWWSTRRAAGAGDGHRPARALRAGGADRPLRDGRARPADPGVTGIDDTPQAAMHGEMARRRVYLHPIRWTSLGSRCSRRCTSACRGRARDHGGGGRRARRGGAVSTDVGRLAARLRELVGDPDAAGPRAPPRVAPRSPATASSVF